MWKSLYHSFFHSDMLPCVNLHLVWAEVCCPPHPHPTCQAVFWYSNFPPLKSLSPVSIILPAGNHQYFDSCCIHSTDRDMMIQGNGEEFQALTLLGTAWFLPSFIDFFLRKKNILYILPTLLKTADVAKLCFVTRAQNYKKGNSVGLRVKDSSLTTPHVLSLLPANFCINLRI
jgi:hypothetical protein